MLYVPSAAAVVLTFADLKRSLDLKRWTGPFPCIHFGSSDSIAFEGHMRPVLMVQHSDCNSCPHFHPVHLVARRVSEDTCSKTEAQPAPGSH